MTFQSGIFDKTRLISNILMLTLVASNLFLTIQYTENLRQQSEAKEDPQFQVRLQSTRFLKNFINIVLNSDQAVSFEDRVMLENDIRQMHDQNLTDLWDLFVNSKDGKTAQLNAVKLMTALSNKTL